MGQNQGRVTKGRSKSREAQEEISAAGRKAIVDALKKGWAAKKAANASEAQSAPAPKKAARKKKAA
jgi:hypothetical protein